MSAYNCRVEVQIKSICYPETYLNDSDCVYAAVRLFGTTQLTSLVSPTFPLIFHDKFEFEKLFLDISTIEDVYRCFKNITIHFAFFQTYHPEFGGTLLAYKDGNAYDVLIRDSHTCENGFLCSHEVYLHPTLRSLVSPVCMKFTTTISIQKAVVTKCACLQQNRYPDICLEEQPKPRVNNFKPARMCATIASPVRVCPTTEREHADDNSLPYCQCELLLPQTRVTAKPTHQEQPKSYLGSKPTSGSPSFRPMCLRPSYFNSSDDSANPAIAGYLCKSPLLPCFLCDKDWSLEHYRMSDATKLNDLLHEVWHLFYTVKDPKCPWQMGNHEFSASMRTHTNAAASSNAKAIVSVFEGGRCRCADCQPLNIGEACELKTPTKMVTASITDMLVREVQVEALKNIGCLTISVKPNPVPSVTLHTALNCEPIKTEVAKLFSIPPSILPEQDDRLTLHPIRYQHIAPCPCLDTPSAMEGPTAKHCKFCVSYANAPNTVAYLHSSTFGNCACTLTSSAKTAQIGSPSADLSFEHAQFGPLLQKIDGHDKSTLKRSTCSLLENWEELAASKKNSLVGNQKSLFSRSSVVPHRFSRQHAVCTSAVRLRPGNITHSEEGVSDRLINARLNLSAESATDTRSKLHPLQVRNGFYSDVPFPQSRQFLEQKENLGNLIVQKYHVTRESNPHLLADEYPSLKQPACPNMYTTCDLQLTHSGSFSVARSSFSRPFRSSVPQPTEDGTTHFNVLGARALSAVVREIPQPTDSRELSVTNDFPPELSYPLQSEVVVEGKMDPLSNHQHKTPNTTRQLHLQHTSTTTTQQGFYREPVSGPSEYPPKVLPQTLSNSTARVLEMSSSDPKRNSGALHNQLLSPSLSENCSRIAAYRSEPLFPDDLLNSQTSASVLQSQAGVPYIPAWHQGTKLSYDPMIQTPRNPSQDDHSGVFCPPQNSLDSRSSQDRIACSNWRDNIQVPSRTHKEHSATQRDSITFGVPTDSALSTLYSSETDRRNQETFLPSLEREYRHPYGSEVNVDILGNGDLNRSQFSFMYLVNLEDESPPPLLTIKDDGTLESETTFLVERPPITPKASKEMSIGGERHDPDRLEGSNHEWVSYDITRTSDNPVRPWVTSVHAIDHPTSEEPEKMLTSTVQAPSRFYTSKPDISKPVPPVLPQDTNGPLPNELISQLSDIAPATVVDADAVGPVLKSKRCARSSTKGIHLVKRAAQSNRDDIHVKTFISSVPMDPTRGSSRMNHGQRKRCVVANRHPPIILRLSSAQPPTSTTQCGCMQKSVTDISNKQASQRLTRSPHCCCDSSLNQVTEHSHRPRMVSQCSLHGPNAGSNTFRLLVPAILNACHDRSACSVECRTFPRVRLQITPKQCLHVINGNHSKDCVHVRAEKNAIKATSLQTAGTGLHNVIHRDHTRRAKVVGQRTPESINHRPSSHQFHRSTRTATNVKPPLRSHRGRPRSPPSAKSGSAVINQGRLGDTKITVTPSNRSAFTLPNSFIFGSKSADPTDIPTTKYEPTATGDTNDASCKLSMRESILRMLSLHKLSSQEGSC
ncbi:unnamed protein product [Dicrocoelium dendriticum]|nr:unnamed protein product [Dicrocoelium dendriticum]